ncbi:MAG: competence protein ComEC, partial [Thermoleophilales bacterium]|nr:competence protein ComEC [Thermoleophilales bacterium]
MPAAPFIAAGGVSLAHPGVRTVTVTTTGAQPTTPAQPTKPAPAEIDYVDVAQGDGVVMRIGGRFIVSDAGQRNVGAVDEALKRLGADKTIDVAILSHAHSDHVKNFLDLIDTFGWTIHTVVLSQSAWWTGTATNRTLIETLQHHGAALIYVTAGQRFGWGGASWEILSPGPGQYTGVGQVADASV